MTYFPISPDFTSIVKEEVVLPYREKPYLRLSFSDPMLAGYEVTVIEDSSVGDFSGSDGDRLFTIVARFPRCILSEVNTHRVFGRNSASSRARSVKTTIRDVMEDPYIPLFTKNQRGMSGVFLNKEDRERATVEWLKARNAAVDAELRLLVGEMIPHDKNYADKYSEILDKYYESVYEAETPDIRAISVHKQDANRIIEPFMWHEAIITSSYWDNFIELRTDLSAAQPAIVALAVLVEEALKTSTPENTWLHLPFIDPADKPKVFDSFKNVRDVVLRSATECAQISYRDKSRAVKTTATVSLGERLLAMKHFSPFEHVAFSREAYLGCPDVDLPTDSSVFVSNLDPRWVQLRKVLSV